MYNNKITGLVLCAGLSKRMGQLKPLIHYNKKPFLAHVILKLHTFCENVVIITGYKSDYIKTEILSWLDENSKDIFDKITWCYNSDFENGMLSSLQKGIKEIKHSDWILYHFADQPHIPDEFYKKFINQIDYHYDWIQPEYKTQSGHPILFSKKIIKEILNLNGDESLRDIAKDSKLKRKQWKCDFPEILKDYDTPDQLNELMEKS